MFPIIEKTDLSATVSKFVIGAPYIAKKRKPGNFIMLRLDETGERIPLTIVDGDTGRGTITLIVQAIGKTTKALCRKKKGDVIIDVVGPLGNPTPLEYHGRVACVGGGVGTAELLPIATGLKGLGNKLYTVIGARTKELIILESEMSGISDGLYITTDDGSYGRKGFVTDQLRELLEGAPGIDAVYAIGPLPMMKAVSHLTKHYGVKTYVSLNAIMVDGTGMCGGCRVTVGGEMKFACVDGPEFNGHDVDFDELMMRNRTYGDLEKAADVRQVSTP
jgi:ferredoxin--NADP+ reductase